MLIDYNFCRKHQQYIRMRNAGEIAMVAAPKGHLHETLRRKDRILTKLWKAARGSTEEATPIS